MRNWCNKALHPLDFCLVFLIPGNPGPPVPSTPARSTDPLRVLVVHCLLAWKDSLAGGKLLHTWPAGRPMEQICTLMMF